jgi:hypothetical protein
LECGDFTTALLDTAAEMSPQFWTGFSDHMKLAQAVKEELLRLRRDNKAVPRRWLKAIREASARCGFEPARSWTVIVNGLVGIKVHTDLSVDQARRVLVQVNGERFELPVQ